MGKVKIFDLEIIDHSTGRVVESCEGTAYSLSKLIQDILENLPDECGVIINESE